MLIFLRLRVRTRGVLSTYFGLLLYYSKQAYSSVLFRQLIFPQYAYLNFYFKIGAILILSVSPRESPITVLYPQVVVDVTIAKSDVRFTALEIHR